MKNNIETCRYVRVSKLFKGLEQLWECLVESDPPFTWGDNNMSMVSIQALVEHMDKWARDDDKQMNELRKRLAKLPADVYLDLEN